jgi:uncharacterized coiled-coil protein SlyX
MTGQEKSEPERRVAVLEKRVADHRQLITELQGSRLSHLLPTARLMLHNSETMLSQARGELVRQRAAHDRFRPYSGV